MITWNLTLSGQQIALLKFFSGRVAGEEFTYRGREEKFMREGLLEHRDVRDDRGYCDVDRSGHFITERGRFILGMIETDIDKFLTVKQQAKSKRSLKKVS